MTMMITKFHRLIESKLLWGVFLVVIIFSFVIWGTQMPSQDDLDRERSLATLHGKPVTPEEFRFSRFNTYLGLVMQIGQPIPYTSELDQELEPVAWRRLASLRKARDLGLVASDLEVISGLEQQPIFMRDGRFDRELYRGFVQSYLPASLQIGLSMEQFEEHIRDEISMSKLQAMVRESVLIPPFELRRRYHLYNDRYTIEYVLLDREAVAADVAVDESDARRFFEENPEGFERPASVAVRYLTLPIDNFLEPDAVTEQEIQFFYDQNLSRWALDIEVDEESDEDLAMEAYRPLEEVRDEIVAELARQHARYKAAFEAAAMIDLLMPDREGKAPTFEEVAARYDLDVRTTDPLSPTDRPEQFGAAAADFVSNAFLLNDHPEEYFSNPVEGEDEIYILALQEIVPPRIPEFEEVRTQALLQARRRAIEEAVGETARALSERAREPDAPAFAELVGELGLSVSRLDDFTASEGLADIDYAQEIVQAVSSLNPGDIGTAIPTADGFLIVHMVSVEPASDAGFAAYAEQVTAQFGQQVAGLTFVDWQEQLLRDGGFERRTFEE